jgi:hypothetical protein
MADCDRVHDGGTEVTVPEEATKAETGKPKEEPDQNTERNEKEENPEKTELKA